MCLDYIITCQKRDLIWASTGQCKAICSGILLLTNPYQIFLSVQKVSVQFSKPNGKKCGNSLKHHFLIQQSFFLFFP